jgi:tetratricopeptide (TPR) repeat protein
MIRAVLALVFLAAAALAQSGLEQAVKALEAEDYAQAAPLLETALAEDPQNVEIRFNLAFAYAQLQQDDKAIEQYSKVVEQRPELGQARMNLGLVLLRQGKPAEAAPHFQKLSEARPEDFRAQFHYAQALDAAGQFEQAIPVYQKALALDAQSADASLGLGRSLARAGRFPEAREPYHRAAQLDPELASSVLELAELLEKGGREPEALEIYQQYLTAHPEEIAVQERAALLLLAQKRHQEAIPLLEKAVARSPSAANQAALASAYALAGNSEKALAAWRGAVAADPADADLRLRYAHALLAAQAFREAAEHYAAALDRDSGRVEAWNGLAFSLYRLEDYNGTLRALGELRARNQENPAGIYLAAITKDKLQMYTEAKSDYERFLAAKPGMEDEEFKARQRLLAIEKILAKGLGK